MTMCVCDQIKFSRLFHTCDGQCSQLWNPEECAPGRYGSRGLANVERSSWSTHRRPEFWGSHEELDPGEDYDKFVSSFKDKYPGMCEGRSI